MDEGPKALSLGAVMDLPQPHGRTVGQDMRSAKWQAGC